MFKNSNLKVNVSISDFPILFSMSKTFKQLKDIGADGVEIVSGLKTHWPFESIKTISNKYHLPVKSIHQSIPSGLNIYFDKNFLKLSRDLNCNNFVVHPLPNISLKDKRSEIYFKKLAKIKRNLGIQILLENLPKKYSVKMVDKLFSPNIEACDPISIAKAAKKFGFKTTFDTSHFHHPEPHKLKWFKDIFPQISNIHLSSFDDKRSHLPLYMGDFRTKAFMSFLRKEHYKGIITLEIYYPKFISLTSLDFSVIEKSIKLIKY